MIMELSAAAAAILYLRSRTATTGSTGKVITSREVDAAMGARMGAAASAAATAAAPEAARQALAAGATPEQASQAAASAAAYAAQHAANDTYTDTIHPVNIQGIKEPDGTTSRAEGRLMPVSTDTLVIHQDSTFGLLGTRHIGIPAPFTLEAWKRADSGDYLIRNGITYIIDKPQGLA